MSRADIYGTDDNGFAESVSSDALTNTAGTEDVWSKSLTDATKSKGNLPADPGEVEVVHPNKKDSRAKSRGN